MSTRKQAGEPRRCIGRCSRRSSSSRRFATRPRTSNGWSRAVAAQELPPARWIVVDDNSDDATLELLRALEPEVEFLTVAEAPRAPPRRCATGSPAQPRRARSTPASRSPATSRAYTHVMKLDGDIELAPSYLRELMERFAADPSLGLAGGVLDEPLADGGFRRLRIARNHVHGALKCYSRECFDRDRRRAGAPRLGHDRRDVRADARLRHRQLHRSRSLHLRPIGSADGTVRGHARHGECAYIAHQHGVVGDAAGDQGRQPAPVGLSGLAFVYGYFRAAARRVERVPDREYQRFTHRELRRRMRGSLVPRLRRTA